MIAIARNFNLEFAENSSALDLGCGISDRGRRIAATGTHVIAVDISKEIVQKQNSLATQEGLRSFSAVQHDIENLPFSDSTFDTVLAIEVLEHVKSPARALKEAVRILKPRGQLIISIPTPFSELVFEALHPHYKTLSGHQRRISREEILTWLKDLNMRLVNEIGANGEWTYFWLLHCLFRSNFNDSGVVTSNHWINRIFELSINAMQTLRLLRPWLKLINFLTPKSRIFVSEKNTVH